MRILVAPCAYKGTLQASDLAKAIAQGITQVFEQETEQENRSNSRELEIELAPVADGGDDTISCLQLALGGDFVYDTVSGPISQPIKAAYLRLGRKAVVELAQASGIAHLQENQLAALQANTFGTGQIVARVIEDGATEVAIMLGGSASTDGGSAVLAALGAKFYDGAGNAILTDGTVCGGGALSSIAHIDLAELRRKIAGVEFLIATDVTNPLLGSQGAAAIFSPQKGANSEEVDYLERSLEHFASVLETACQSDKSWRSFAGAGAAGGAGFGLALGLGAHFTSGFHWLAEQTNLAEKLNWCDLVIVAEGCLDSQSLSGKASGEILKLARAAGKMVAALPACSQLTKEQEEQFDAVITTASPDNLATLVSVRQAARGLFEASGAFSRN
ncbi:glycerate kinase [bacterium]|nr:glycerate kinase [bacterium]MBP9808408.1 glycerate kinase [bacterium]